MTYQCSHWNINVLKKKSVFSFISVLVFLFFYLYFILFLFLFLLLRAASAAYGRSQARGWIRATAASLHHSHSNVGSKLITECRLCKNGETESNHYKKQERTQHDLRNVASHIFQSFPQGCKLLIIVPTRSENSAICKKADMPFSGGFYSLLASSSFIGDFGALSAHQVQELMQNLLNVLLSYFYVVKWNKI